MMGGAGNPMMAKFGGALMGGQNPLQAMMSNPNDFAKWAAMRRQQQPGQAPPMQIGQPQAPPSSTPQPPMPTQQTGMLGGLM
jgi:hypothetical protein